MKKNDWLLEYSKDIHSQRGEDGILEKIFEIISVNNPWCVEFGAWDGKHLSNTYNLAKNKNWSGVFIEGDAKRFQDLVKTYGEKKNAICLNEMVSFEGDKSLDNLLKNTPIPKDFDLLSIDIDGNDYHIWDSVKVYKPKVVIIEFNPTIQNHIEFIQPKDMSVNQGSSLKSLVRLGKEKGYELVSCTLLNAIFVKKEYYSKFEIANNSPEELFKDKRYHTSLFHLYDGTVKLHGCDTVMWHGVRIKNCDIQVVPRFFRIFPSNMSKFRMRLFKIWRKLSSISLCNCDKR